MQIWMKRVYKKPGTRDGVRVLVDRLWPRGINKDKARIDLWLKDLAPSNELRNWFGHDRKKWEGFKERYYCELNTKRREAVEKLEEIAGKGRVTLVYASADECLNNAVALKKYMEEGSAHR
jgi:uncharacterized protein YeaO (DUF488 family)